MSMQKYKRICYKPFVFGFYLRGAAPSFVSSCQWLYSYRCRLSLEVVFQLTG